MATSGEERPLMDSPVGQGKPRKGAETGCGNRTSTMLGMCHVATEGDAQAINHVSTVAPDSGRK